MLKHANDEIDLDCEDALAVSSNSQGFFLLLFFNLKLYFETRFFFFFFQ